MDDDFLRPRFYMQPVIIIIFIIIIIIIIIIVGERSGVNKCYVRYQFLCRDFHIWALVWLSIGWSGMTTCLENSLLSFNFVLYFTTERLEWAL